MTYLACFSKLSLPVEYIFCQIDNPKHWVLSKICPDYKSRAPSQVPGGRDV